MISMPTNVVSSEDLEKKDLKKILHLVRCFIEMGDASMFYCSSLLKDEKELDSLVYLGECIKQMQKADAVFFVSYNGERWDECSKCSAEYEIATRYEKDVYEIEVFIDKGECIIKKNLIEEK